MNHIIITLPFSPSINGLFNGGSGQKRFPSKAYKSWLKLCPKLTPHGFDNVELQYSYYFPDKRERDTENYVKAVSDYLVNEGVLTGDHWKVVKKMTLVPEGVCKENPRVIVQIKILEKEKI